MKIFIKPTVLIIPLALMFPESITMLLYIYPMFSLLGSILIRRKKALTVNFLPLSVFLFYDGSRTPTFGLAHDHLE